MQILLDEGSSRPIFVCLPHHFEPLETLASPSFDYYLPWESKDDAKASVLKKLNQIKVQYAAPAENANREKDMVAHVVPDQGSSAKFFLTFSSFARARRW